MIDYDLESCLGYNPQPGLLVEDIVKIIAVWEGENDGGNWSWVLKLKGNKFVYLTGGCDYTGWDCRSWAYSSFTSTALKAAKLESRLDVRESLINQVKGKKNETWREKMDKEFNL